tara:strand:+ start:588 stop:1097 length:510 start_codon:yes stop_codon:yes gene_type:complete
MKDFRTFVNSQKELLTEKKAANTSTKHQTSGADRSGTIASLGHGDDASKIMVSAPFIDFKSPFSDKVLYAFGEFMNRLPALDKYVMTSGQKSKLTDTINKIAKVDRRRADYLLGEMEKISTLPASADRTKRVQSIINDINGFETQLTSGSRSYASVQPEPFTREPQRRF